MVVKFLSLLSLVCAVAISSLSFKDPSDPLFFVVAGSIGVGLLRIALTSAMVALAFFSLPKKISTNMVLLPAGVIFMAFGVSGFLLNSYDYAFYDYLKPLDFLLLAEAGIVFNLVALEAHKPMFRFSAPYHKTFTIAFLPKLRKLKPATG